MARKIIGVLCVLIGVACIIGGVATMRSGSADAALLQDAVYVTDGKINSENEGKLVVVSGTAEITKPIVDEQTGIVLPGLKAMRTAETCKQQHNTETNEYTWEWNVVLEGTDSVITSGSVVAEAKIGEFDIDGEILATLPASVEYEDYTDEELDENGWNASRDKGRLYLHRAKNIPYSGELVSRWDEDYTHKVRVAYKVMPADAPAEYTMIGIQQGSKLVLAGDTSFLAAMEGIQSPEQVAALQEGYNRGGWIAAFAFAAAFLALGIFLIVKPKKRKKKRHRKGDAVF